MQTLLPQFASLDSGGELGLAMRTAYNPILVTVSILIATLAAHAALGGAGRMRAARTSTGRRLWLIAGAMAMGIGVWAMHFIGMLALTLPVVVGYDVLITLLSMVPAILASALVLHLLGQTRIGGPRLVFGGVLMGAGIGTMH